MSNVFEEVELRAWEHDGTEEFVGHGWLQISCSRCSRSDRLPYLRFRLRGKIISRDEAKRHVEKWNDDCAAKRSQA